MKIEISKKCRRHCGVDHISIKDIETRNAIINDDLKEIFITSGKLDILIASSANDCRRVRKVTKLFNLLAKEGTKAIYINKKEMIMYMQQDYKFIARTGYSKHNNGLFATSRLNEKDFDKASSKGIYAIHNNTTKETYIGMTTASFNNRLKQHYASKQLDEAFLLDPNTKMYIIESIDTDKESMIQIESDYIRKARKDTNIKLLNTYDYFNLNN